MSERTPPRELDARALMHTDLDAHQVGRSLSNSERDGLLVAKLATAIMTCAEEINEHGELKSLNLTRGDFYNQSSPLSANRQSSVSTAVRDAQQTLESIPRRLAAAETNAENDPNAITALVQQLMQKSAELSQVAQREMTPHPELTGETSLTGQVRQITDPARAFLDQHPEPY